MNRTDFLNQTLDYVAKPIDPNNHSVWSNLTDSVSVPSQKYEKTLQGLVLHINSLSDFYLQMENADETLMNMRIEPGERLEKLPSNGTLCVAKYHVDGQYYRVRIIKIITNSNTSVIGDLDPMAKYSTEAKIKVLYIDFGNVEIVTLTNLYRITSDIKNIKPLALNCKLNFSNTLNSWIERNADLKPETLIKCLKNLTSKSKVEAKVIETCEGKALVDLFIENQNVCDKLLLNAMSLLKPLQVENIDSSIDEINKFDAYLISPDMGQFFNAKSNITEIRVLNDSMLNKICDDVDLDIHQKCVKDEICSLAPLPDKIKNKFSLRHQYGRVFMHTTENMTKKSNKKEVLVSFIDLGYQKWIEKCELVSGNGILSKMPPSVEKFNLNLCNNHDLTRLNTQQLLHLNEIFKMLIFYESDEIEASTYSYSSKLKARVIQTNNSSFRNNDNAELRSVRLLDEQRENLDINYVIEKCITLMVKDFKGHLINFEHGYSKFDCINNVSFDLRFMSELNKIYRSLKRFDNLNDDDFEQLKPGMLCLLDGHKSTNQPLLGNSIISLNDFSCMDPDSTQVDQDEKKEQLRQENNINRCIILEENGDKVCVYNVDNGKQLTINKKRLRSIDMNERFNLNDRRYMSCVLIKMLPFMVIKAKPDKEIKDEAIKSLIHKSHVYKEKIQLNVIGTYSSTLDFIKNSDEVKNDLEKNLALKSSGFSQFIQTQKDLFKIVDVRQPIIEKPKGNNLVKYYFQYKFFKKFRNPFNLKNNYFIFRNQTDNYVCFIFGFLELKQAQTEST